MSDGQPQKPKFEPPPWEQEAFERFRSEQEEARKQAELDAALLTVREAPSRTVEPASAPEVVTAADRSPGPAASPGEAAQDEVVSGQPVAVGSGTPSAGAVVSEAKIDSMLIQLKGEEPTIAPVSTVFVNVLVAVFELSGLFVVVQAALLFGKTRATGAAGLLGAVASLIVLFVGLGFMGGGFMLFRKHHS